jgi:hypothetical protein
MPSAHTLHILSSRPLLHLPAECSVRVPPCCGLSCPNSAFSLTSAWATLGRTAEPPAPPDSRPFARSGASTSRCGRRAPGWAGPAPRGRAASSLRSRPPGPDVDRPLSSLVDSALVRHNETRGLPSPAPIAFPNHGRLRSIVLLFHRGCHLERPFADLHRSEHSLIVERHRFRIQASPNVLPPARTQGRVRSQVTSPSAIMLQATLRR